MDSFLRCSASPGQFSDELAIDCEDFSLFAPRGSVELDRQPGPGNPVEGWLRVDVIEQGRDRALVRLPGEALEVGCFVHVRNDRLRTGRGRP